MPLLSAKEGTGFVVTTQSFLIDSWSRCLEAEHVLRGPTIVSPSGKRFTMSLHVATSLWQSPVQKQNPREIFFLSQS
jgi:hypothetical protein